MEKKEAIKKLNQDVAIFFESEGYVPFSTPYEAGWKRKSTNGDIVYIDFAYIPRAGNVYFQIEPSIIIRIKEIEDVYRQIASIKNMNYELAIRTLNAKISEIQAFPDGILTGTDHPIFNWLIRSDSDIHDVGIKLIENVKKIAFPYIQKNANTRQIDKLLNENTKHNVVHMGSYPIRIIIGLIAGKLVGRVNLSELIEFYDTIMKETTIAIQDEYHALKMLLPTVQQKYYD